MSTTNTSRAGSVRRGTPGAVAYNQRAEASAPRQPLMYACELVLLVLGLAMAVLVARHPAPLPGDVGVALDIQHLLLPNKVVTQGLDAVSAINWPIPSAIAIVVAVVVLLVVHRRLAALITLVTSGLADGSSFLTNEIVRRPRPSDHGLHVLQHITNYYSFPSGHVIHALAFYGFLVYLTFQVRRPAAWLWAIRAILVALIVLMPVSRILEGEHWPSDVLEGLLYGTFWLILGIHAYRWAGRRWPRLRGSHDEQSVQEVPAPSSAGARQVRAGPVRFVSYKVTHGHAVCGQSPSCWNERSVRYDMPPQGQDRLTAYPLMPILKLVQQPMAWWMLCKRTTLRQPAG